MASLYYIHDPMCSWCWGFVPTLTDLLHQLPAAIETHRVLGGLAPDTRETMPADMQAGIQENWRRIEKKIPGIRFNFDFWTRCTPRRSTHPACRAVIAARLQGDRFDREMTAAIQRAYYREARNPSDDSTLMELADELGLDTGLFSSALNSTEVKEILDNEILLARQLYAESFPNLVLRTGGSDWPIPVDYRDSAPMLELIQTLVDDKPTGDKG